MGDRSERAIGALVEGLLNDPLVEIVMQADGVSREAAHAALTQACIMLAARTGMSLPPSADIILSLDRNSQFRTGVGILLFNSEGDVFVGQRNDVVGDAWQMPQGGVDEGEAPLEAALRELREEVGTDQVEVMAESTGWLLYEWPPDVARRVWDGQWRGQQQKWFAMRFLGQDRDINIATPHPEFSAWRWVPLEEIPSLIVAFKRPVYEHVVRLFGDQTTSW